MVLENVASLHHVAPEDYPHAWSPSGDAIIFESDQLGPYAIFKQKLDGSPAVLLARSQGNSATPAVTPDGQWVIFSDFAGNPPAHVQALYKVPLKGGRVEQLPIEGDIDSFDCSVGAAGQCVLRKKVGTQFVYYELDPKIGQGRELARTEWTQGLLGDWSVSEDGTLVVTVSHDPSHPAIHFENLGGLGHAVADLPIATAGNPIEVREAADRPGFFVESRVGYESSLLFVSRSGNAVTLREGLFSIWGVPSRQGKLAFPYPTDNTNLWLATAASAAAR